MKTETCCGICDVCKSVEAGRLCTEDRNYTLRIATTREVEPSIFSGRIQWKQRLVVFVMVVKLFPSGSRWKQAVSAPKL